MEDSRTDFKTDSQTSKPPTITAASVVARMNQELLVKEKVLRSLEHRQLQFSNNSNNQMQMHSTGALVLLLEEVFLINHLEIGLRVSRELRIKVQPQLHLNQDQDLLKHKEHQEEALVEAVLLIKTCRRGLLI